MNRLKELRIRHGYKTQKELADVLFVNQTAVSQWERGATVPSSQMLVKLSELYGESIDYILGTDSKEKESPSNASQRDIQEDDIKAAFFNGADPTLTPEERDAMWEDAQEYFRFKIEQRRRKQQDGE